jgi:transcriptional regulator with XRE-family HTH domain
VNARSQFASLRKPPNAIDHVAKLFAHQLAELRAQRGETQKQLATRLGMTESMVSRLESGDHLPSIATLCRIANGFERRLEIAFHEHEHEHEHEHADGIRHKHVHGHDDFDHMHDHEDA